MTDNSVKKKIQNKGDKKLDATNTLWYYSRNLTMKGCEIYADGHAGAGWYVPF